MRKLNETSFSNLTASSYSSLSDFSTSSSSITEIGHSSTSQFLSAIPTSSLSTIELRNTKSNSTRFVHPGLTSESRQKSSSQTPQTTTPKKPTNTTNAHITGSHTRISLHPVPTNGSCHSYCNYLGARKSTLIWTPACMATLAAHTIIHVINNRTNTTRTITRSIDLSGIDDLGIVSLGGTPTRTTAPQTTVTLSRGPSSALTTVM